MNDSNKAFSLRDSLQLTLRGYQVLNRYFPGLVLSMILYNAFTAAFPYVGIWLSARIINELAGLRRPDLLWKLVLAALGSTLVLGFLCKALQVWDIRMENRFYCCREQIFTDKLLSMDYENVDKAEVRSLLNKIRENENWSDWGFAQLLRFCERGVSGIAGVLGAVVLTASLFTMPVPQGRLTFLNHPLFVLLIIGLLALATWFGSFCRNKSTAAYSVLSEQATQGNRIGIAMLLSDQPKAALDVRMYEQQKITRWYMEQDKTFEPGGIMARCAAGPQGLWAALGAGIEALLIGIIYLFVCLKAWAGAFGVGSVTQYVGAVTALTKNISMLMEGLGGLKSNAPFMRDAFGFLDLPNKMYQGSLTTEKRSDREYDVEFRDVSFKYPDTDLWALRHVNMKFKVGRRLAVVGENGSGKSTFIKLLCRLYDPTEGAILLNGIDIRKYKYEDYIDIFSVVFQDFQLISQPLGANVAGCTDYNSEQAAQALKDSGFADRLASLPDGLNTMLYRDIDPEGVDISGGEAQKIAIARALYKNAPFIILDEPTAALDPIAEAEIYSKFNEISGDRTAIYISHRLSSCKFCDEIAVFHAGEVVQQGSHEELLADTQGKYAQLWNAQAQYYTAN